MIHATAYHEGISSANVKSATLAGDPEMAAHDVDNLIVRVAVHRAGPAFHHQMFGEKKFVVVGEHAAREAGFGWDSTPWF